MKDRVICNAPVWALTKLISSDDGRSILDANGTGGDVMMMITMVIIKNCKRKGKCLQIEDLVKGWTTRANDERKTISLSRFQVLNKLGTTTLRYWQGGMWDTLEQTASLLHRSNQSRLGLFGDALYSNGSGFILGRGLRGWTM